MELIKDVVTKEDYINIYDFCHKLNCICDEEGKSFDELTEKYYDRLITSLYGFISDYRKNLYIDISYLFQLIRNNMYNLMEDYRKEDIEKYLAFQKIYNLLLDIENKCK